MKIDPRPIAEMVHSQILALKEKHPELADDADLLADTIEGVTDFDRVIDKLAMAAVEARGLSAGLNETIGKLKTRQQRFDKLGAAMRDMALQLMLAAECKKIVVSTATLWTRKGGASVVVDDVNELPQGFTTTTVAADTPAIKKSLEAGEAVPGAHLEQSGPSISIRTV